VHLLAEARVRDWEEMLELTGAARNAFYALQETVA
jgi:hypothetical protein